MGYEATPGQPAPSSPAVCPEAQQESMLIAERVDCVIRSIGTAGVYSSVEMSELILGKQDESSEEDGDLSLMAELETALRHHPAVEAIPARATRTAKVETVYKVFPHPDGRESEDSQELAVIEEIASRLFALTGASLPARNNKIHNVSYFLRRCETNAKAIPGAAELLKDPARLKIVRLLAMQHMHVTNFSPPRRQPAPADAPSTPSKSTLSTRRRRSRKRAAAAGQPTNRGHVAPAQEKPKLTAGEQALKGLLRARIASIVGTPGYLGRLAIPGRGGTDRSFKTALIEAAAGGDARVHALPRGCYLIVGKEDVDDEARVERYVSMAGHMDNALEAAYYAPVQGKALTPGLVSGILHELMGDPEPLSTEDAERSMILSLIYSHPWWVSRKDHNSANKIVLPEERRPAGRLRSFLKSATAQGSRIMSREAILAEINPPPSLAVRAKFDRLLSVALEEQPGFVPIEIGGVELYKLSSPEENRIVEDIGEGQMEEINRVVGLVADRLLAEEFLSVPARRCIELARATGADLSDGLEHVFVASLAAHPALTPRENDPTLFDIALPKAEAKPDDVGKLFNGGSQRQKKTGMFGSDVKPAPRTSNRKSGPTGGGHQDKYAGLRGSSQEDK